MKGKRYLKSMVEDKIRLQSRATEKYHEQIFEEMKELEKRNHKRLWNLCRKSKICGDVRMNAMKQEGCGALET